MEILFEGKGVSMRKYATFKKFKKYFTKDEKYFVRNERSMFALCTWKKHERKTGK